MPQLLNRLELIGFKSFAEKTTLEFPRGITAIVGPNGSGKSNIIDAVRWLLGEREARQLRGAKTEDLIFAGTPKRPRVGQAQASLYFNNANHFFPLDFEEIVVSRQVSRDGTNKYFINKAEVRLKDLVDFFAQARLGSRGLTVITQGNSDMFIRATARERREMIEEVLGLREYQIKKADAERRLEQCRINLEKAQALLDEIGPHLKSLRRQTNRWEKRSELEHELRELENGFFGSQWHAIQKGLHEVEKTLHEKKTAREALQKEKEEAEHRVKQVEEGEPKERAELKQVKTEIQALLKTKSELQKELGKLEVKVEIQTARSQSVDVDAKKAHDALAHIRETLARGLESGHEALAEAVRETLRVIDLLFRGDFAESENGGHGDGAVLADLQKLKVSLEKLERELEDLTAKEKGLEGTHELFYASYKEALGALQKIRDLIQDSDGEFQHDTIVKERLVIRRDELERNIRQAGRTTKEFEILDSNTLPGVQEDAGGLERRMFRLRGELAAIGEIDETIMKEARETEERHAFLEKESVDLRNAQGDLKELIKNLEEKISVEFNSALKKINVEFQKLFSVMFGGGSAKLTLSEPRTAADKTDIPEGQGLGNPEDDEEFSGREEIPGIEVKLALPRKRLTSLEVLSGGERSLVGIAALFSLISVSPPPFLVLDEIDAPLDDRNARRFSEMLAEFTKETQFVVVTHNRATMEAANVLYGVTLQEDGTSKVLSMKLE